MCKRRKHKRQNNYMCFKYTALITSFLLTALFLITDQSFAAQEEVYIKVRSTRLRAAPQHYANSIATLSLGQALTVIKKEGAWLQTKTKDNKSGYIHESAITERKTTLALSRSASKSASASDTALAGKGFSREVEKQFASRNPNLTFADVDAMEKIVISDSTLKSFVVSGGLKENA
jgi:uncharacterized protein YgiM (DUF1202 family)